MSNKYYTTKKENRRKTKRRRKKRGGWGHEDLVDFVKKGKEFAILYTIANPSNPAAADKHWVGGDEDFVFETHKEFTEALQVQAAEYKNPFKGKIEIIHIAAEGDYREAAFAEFTANNISRTTPGHYSIDLVDVVGGTGDAAGFTNLQEKSVSTPHPGYRGLGLCSVMLKKLLSAFATIPQAHSVTIHLASETPKGACYCYTKAANRIGYTVGIDIGKAGELGFITKKTKKINTFFWTTFNDAGEWRSDDSKVKMIVNPEEPNPVVKGKVYNRLCVELPTRPRIVAKRNTRVVQLYLRYQADVYPLNLQRPRRGGSTPGMRKRTRRRTRRKSRKKRGGKPCDPPLEKRAEWLNQKNVDTDAAAATYRANCLRKLREKKQRRLHQQRQREAQKKRDITSDVRMKGFRAKADEAMKFAKKVDKIYSSLLETWIDVEAEPEKKHLFRRWKNKSAAAKTKEKARKEKELTKLLEQAKKVVRAYTSAKFNPTLARTAFVRNECKDCPDRGKPIPLFIQIRNLEELYNAITGEPPGTKSDLLGGHRKKRRKTRKQRSTGKKGGKRRKTRKKGAGNGSSVSSGSTASSSVAGPGTWIDRLSSIDSSTITPTEPSTERSSTKSSTESDWFFRGQQRPPSDLSGHGVGEDIRLLHGCEVATRSCPCHLPWKTGTCTYDKKRNLIYCKCRWKKEKEAEKIRRRTNLSKAARAFTSSS